MNDRTPRANEDDATVGLAALALAGIYAFFAFRISDSFLADPIGAAGLPELYAIALALLASLLVTRSLTSRATVPETTEASADRLAAGQHLRAVGCCCPVSRICC